jgi:serralysin
MAPVSDIVLLQDLSGSFGDDLPRLREIIGPLVDNLRNPILERIFGADPFFGVSSFVDKPVDPFGSSYSGDYVYRQDLALTSDSNSVVSTVNSSTFSIRNGGDGPEAQLEALLQLTFDPNYRSGSTRIALIVTDAPFHLPPDGVTQAGSTKLLRSLIV